MKKILVIRFSSIGDIVLTSAVLRCLKEQLNCELHFITKSAYASFVKANQYVDKVYDFKQEITEVIAELKNEQYDFIVDLHHNLRSTRLKRALKRPSAAFPKLNRQKFLYTNFKMDVMPDIHIVDRYFKAVEQLGVKNDQKGLDFFIEPQEQVNLSDFGVPATFHAFCIGGQFATKQLPLDKMIELVTKSATPIVLLGGPEDVKAAEAIQTAVPSCINLAGMLSIQQSASVIQQSGGVITHDTGMMHIAAAFKKPIASIWGNTTPKLGMYPYIPAYPDRYSMHEVDALNCRPCSKIGYKKCPKGHFKCMNMQNVDAILQSLQRADNS